MRRIRRLFLFSYYGGKSKIAYLYPVPRYDWIIEPFAGAANYSCLYFSHRVTLHEIDPTIFGVLDFLVRSSREDILRLPLLEVGQSVKDLADLCQEARDFIGMRICFGCTHPQYRITSWGLHNSGCRVWNWRTRQQTAEMARRIKHWKVVCGSGWEAFDRYRKVKEVVWFIDPPYRGKAGERYGSGKIDYELLGQACRSLEGQVIVCEGEDHGSYLPFRRLSYGIKRNQKNEMKWEYIWTKNCQSRPGLLFPYED